MNDDIYVITCHGTPGYCCAMAIKLKYPTAKIIPLAYGKEFPVTIPFGSNVILAKYTFDMDVMKRLSNEYSITWFYANDSVIEEAHLAGLDVPGKLKDDRSEVLSVWEYYHQDKPVPQIVSLLADYDFWNIDKPGVLELHYGMSTLNVYPSDSNFETWKFLFEGGDTLDSCLAHGKQIKSYVDQYNDVVSNDLVFVKEISGKKYLIANTRGTNSLFFNKVMKTGQAGEHKFDPNEIEAFISYGWVKYGDWRCGIYANPAKKDSVDVGEFAKKYGGRGKAGVAGFTTKAPILMDTPGRDIGEADYTDHMNDLYSSFGRSPIIRGSNLKNDKIGVNSSLNTIEIFGLRAAVCNNASTWPEIWTPLSGTYEIGIAYCYTNKGLWRWTITNLNGVDMDGLAKRINGRLVGDTIIRYATANEMSGLMQSKL